MCMLSYFPAGVQPVEDHIQNGADANPDGHGYAMVTRDRQLTIFRSMNANETIERFMEARERDATGPALFHSRIGTSGRIDITGVHPFRVGQDNRTVVAHNGILFSPAADSDRSDTAIFADRMLPRFGSLDNRRKRTKLAKFVGPGNKLVVLTVNPNRRRNAYLINSDMGHWVKGGAWHSNWDYEGWTKYAVATSYHSAPFKSAEDSASVFTNRWTYEPWPCAICGAQQCVDSATMLCRVCDTCQDCLETRWDCLCYYPGGDKDTAAQPYNGAREKLAISDRPANVVNITSKQL